MMNKASVGRMSGMLFVLALVARLLYMFAAKEYYQDKVMACDGKKYESIAKSIIDPRRSNIWPRIPPGYPLFLAGGMKTFGNEYVLAVQMIQIMLSSLVAVLIFVFGSQFLQNSPRLALGAAALWAVFPSALHASLMIGREELLVFLVLCAVFSWSKAVLSGSPGMALLAGVLLAVAGVIKPVPVYLTPVFLLSLFWALPRARLQRLWLGVCLLAPVCAGIFTVSWYNHAQWQQWFYARSGYYEMYCGSKPEYMVPGDLRYERVRQNLFAMQMMRATQVPDEEWEQIVIKDEAFKDLFIKEIKARLYDEPFATFGFFLSKSARLLYMTDTGAHQSILLLLNFPVLALACAGTVVGWRSARPRVKVTTFILASSVVVWALLHSLVIPLNRYFYVITPLMLILAMNMFHRSARDEK